MQISHTHDLIMLLFCSVVLLFLSLTVIILSVFVRACWVRLLVSSVQLKTTYFPYNRCLMLYICGAFPVLDREPSACFCDWLKLSVSAQKPARVTYFSWTCSLSCRSTYAEYGALQTRQFWISLPSDRDSIRTRWLKWTEKLLGSFIIISYLLGAQHLIIPFIGVFILKNS